MTDAEIQEHLDALRHGASKMTDEELREHLGALAQDAWKQMRAATKAKITIHDGIVLKTGVTTRGPCLSLVCDTKTGEVFYGQNTFKEAIGLSEPLATNTVEVKEDNPSMGLSGLKGHPGGSRWIGIPGSHF